MSEPLAVALDGLDVFVEALDARLGGVLEGDVEVGVGGRHEAVSVVLEVGVVESLRRGRIHRLKSNTYAIEILGTSFSSS